MNIANLIDYCNFDDNSCYVLMLIPRKKENGKNTEKDKLNLCKREIVRNKDDLINTIDGFNKFVTQYPNIVFRVYITVEKRDIVKALFALQSEVNNMTKQLFYGNNVTDNVVKIGSKLKSLLCSPETRGEKLFHFDVDWDNSNPIHMKLFNNLCNRLKNITKVKYIGFTLNGYTIVTDCFNPNELKKYYNEANGMNIVPDYVEIKTNSMLYVGVYNYEK